MDVDTPRAMKREREESLTLSLLLGDSRVFSVVLFSLEIETKRDSDDVRKKNWREGRKSFRERAAPLLSLFFSIFLARQQAGTGQLSCSRVSSL